MPQTTAGPTVKQQRALRALAQATGTTFATPSTRREASALIATMNRRRRSSRQEIANDRASVSHALRHRPHDATRVRAHETSGYGSSATWRRPRPDASPFR
ncbi:MAG: hypothetical protein ACRDK4_08530 [Solirubrobacteraceae bacterium]